MTCKHHKPLPTMRAIKRAFDGRKARRRVRPLLAQLAMCEAIAGELSHNARDALDCYRLG